MKLSMLQALSGSAGLAGALMASMSAQAQYTGIEVARVDGFFDSHPNDNVRNSWLDTEGAFDVFRVFATFGGATTQDRVNIVYANLANPGYFTIDSGTVFNQAPTSFSGLDTFNLPPESFSAENAPRAWETWASIGADSATAASFSPGTQVEVDNFLGNWTATNSAWFIAPANTQGAARVYPNQGSAGYKVLILQVAMTAGGAFHGSLNVQTGFGNMLDQTFTSSIPAPGAFAVLAVGGVMSAARRRRA